MLQDPKTIRHYQRLTDALVDLWERGYRFDELRLYVDGYITALRHSQVLEAFDVHHLEGEVLRYLYDVSNFERLQPEAEVERR
jgi:hypothetical protein